MKEHTTYEVLRKAHMGDVDQDKLAKAKMHETDPMLQRAIDMVLKKGNLESIPWNTKPFTTHFREVVNPRDRLHETVITFILRIVAIVKQEQYRRTFTKPESFPVLMAWTLVAKQCIYCLFSLLCGVEWTPTQLIQLDEVILDLVYEGRSGTLREFMISLGIPVADTLYQAENDFVMLSFLHTGQFSSFFWRILHWTAEAVDMRNAHDPIAKLWREVEVDLLYRALRCPTCMYHLKGTMMRLQNEMKDPERNHAELWYDIHNQVHQQRREQYGVTEPDYTRPQFEEDRVFMRNALLP